MVEVAQNAGAAGGLVQKILGMITLLLRVIMLPLRYLGDIILPPGEYDGLSPAVTQKAILQFVSYMKSLASSPAQTAVVLDTFTTLGFSALKTEAQQTGSLIIVYLHSPLHRQAMDMCQLLIHDPLSSFLRQDNIRVMGVSIHTSQGAYLAQQLGATSFPVLAMLQPSASSSTTSSSRNSNSSSSSSSSSNLQLVFKAEGPTLIGLQPQQLIQYLNSAAARHRTVLAEQEARRIQREQEAQLRREQDAEYQEALRADQERERLQREERERERQRQLEEEELERQRVQQEEARLDNARSLLRPEPSAGGTRIRFILPSGQKLHRRFENDETIGALKAFLILHFSENKSDIKNIALSTSFPKQTYDEEDQTLEQCGLSPQCVLMVQDLDA